MIENLKLSIKITMTTGRVFQDYVIVDCDKSEKYFVIKEHEDSIERIYLLKNHIVMIEVNPARGEMEGIFEFLDSVIH